MKTEKCLFLTTIWRLYFHPANIDNFKDEKMSDYKTVSVSQSKNSVSFGVTYQLPTLSFKVIKRIPDSSKIHT